jgi:hypothetical protein
VLLKNKTNNILVFDLLVSAIGIVDCGKRKFRSTPLVNNPVDLKKSQNGSLCDTQSIKKRLRISIISVYKLCTDYPAYLGHLYIRLLTTIYISLHLQIYNFIKMFVN